MGENQDISKIIGVIMENPDIIAKIRSLAESGSEKIGESNSDAVFKTENEEAVSSVHVNNNQSSSRFEANKRRRALLSALKPYVKEDRAKAIDTMLTVIEVVDVMKEK